MEKGGKVAGRYRVVIVGAGFGGLWAARALAGSAAEIVLIDCNNYHTFLPLLYQVAAAELSPDEIAHPVRGLLRKVPNARFMMACVQSIDLAGRLVQTSAAAIPYDYLILAVGSVSHFFGVSGAAENAYRLKSLDQAVALRNHILGCFERAANEPLPDKRRQALTFAVVGGGAMGVEFAGALAELVRGPLRRDYPWLAPSDVRVVLLEGTDHLLPEFENRLQTYAGERLRRMGVEVQLGALVERITAEAVHLRDGRIIPTETTVWTAGVRGDYLVEGAGVETSRQRRVVVDQTLQVPGHPEVYVVGDLAYLEEAGRALPMVAPVALQQGEAAARNILRQVQGLPAEPFHYRDMGRMATIGRNTAVASLGGRGFTGFVAWLLWLVVHLVNLIGFRNRLIVLINWAWDYVMLERAIRLILPSPAPRLAHPDDPMASRPDSGRQPPGVGAKEG